MKMVIFKIELAAVFWQSTGLQNCHETLGSIVLNFFKVFCFSLLFEFVLLFFQKNNLD